LQGAQPVHVARLGELGQRVQVDHGDLRGLAGLLQLPQQFVDFLQFLLDLQRLGNGQRRAAGELVLGRQFVHLVLVSQPFHQLHQAAGERRAFILGGVPEPFQVVQLFLLDGPLEARSERLRR